MIDCGVAERTPYGARQAALFITAAAWSALLLVYRFQPGEALLFPSCWFHALTGLYCPGCGATRALHALLHGEVGRAMDHNFLVVVIGPAIIAWAFFLLYGALRHNRIARLAVPSSVVAGALLLAATFTILRNLPFAPFSSLAP
jgi:hypothetical protein